MGPTETLENEISRLLHGVDRYKRVITRATSRVSIMEGDIELHREALEKLKQSLAKIDERARRQRASTPPSPETPPEPPPARAAEPDTHLACPAVLVQAAQLHEVPAKQKRPYQRRAKRVQIKVYKDTYVTGSYKVPGIETNVGLSVHIIRDAGPAGVTRPELLERSAQYRKVPLDWQCIGSQLHEMIKRGVVRKEGNRYVAN